MLKLILTSDIRDLANAAIRAADWADYITVRDGSPTSVRGTFHALLVCKPWASEDIMISPWRQVRTTAWKLGYHNGSRLYDLRCQLSAVRHGMAWAWCEQTERLTGEGNFWTNFLNGRQTRLYILEEGLDDL